MEPKPKLDELLSHRPLGRILEPDGIGAEFELIRDAFAREAKGGVPDADDFHRVGRASGTHLLKLVTPWAPTGQCVVRFLGQRGANRQSPMYPSLDAKMARIAKVVFRPYEFRDHAPKTLADHILNPDDDLSATVTKAFAEIFGEAALERLRDALTRPLDPVTELPVAEFPIIFLPRPGGGDVQATPLAPAEAYVEFGEITADYFRKNEPGQPRQPRGRWHRQFVADKPQNISGAVGKTRTRFFATMPAVLDRWEAELFRFAQGDRFPRWNDPSVVEEVSAYAALIDRNAEYSNEDIRAGLDRRADTLIRGAREFIDETMAEARQEFPGKDLPRPSSIVDVLLQRKWPKDGFNQARRVLTGRHFRDRLRDGREA